MINMFKTAILLSLLITAFFLQAQTSGKMPLEIAKAFQKGTRSNDGNPGPNYWQNHSNYTINTELLAEKSRLEGSGSIVYYNNSPDTLRRIVMRLYPDLYKKGNSRSWPIAEDDLTDGTIIKKLNINGKDVDIDNGKEVRRSSTNMFISLEDKLIPGDSLQLNIDWEFNIPRKRWVRMGNYGNDGFFSAYW